MSSIHRISADSITCDEIASQASGICPITTRQDHSDSETCSDHPRMHEQIAGEWEWEAAAGPGEEDPFKADWPAADGV